MFCDVRDVPNLRRMAHAPDTEMADFLTAGTLVTAPGGHGTEYELTIPTISSTGGGRALRRCEDIGGF